MLSEEEETGIPVANILTSLVSAFAAAVLTTLFALWRFRWEKWWEKKFLAYEAIFDALHDMTVGIEAEYGEFAHERELPEEQRNKYLEQFNVGRATISKQADIGEFLLPAEAVKALRELLDELHDSQRGESFHEYMHEMYEALTHCLGEIRAIAKNDLTRGPWSLMLSKSNRQRESRFVRPS